MLGGERRSQCFLRPTGKWRNREWGDGGIEDMGEHHGATTTTALLLPRLGRWEMSLRHCPQAANSAWWASGQPAPQMHCITERPLWLGNSRLSKTNLGNGPGFTVLQKLETSNQSCKADQNYTVGPAAVCNATLTSKHETEKWERWRNRAVGGRQREAELEMRQR